MTKSLSIGALAFALFAQPGVGLAGEPRTVSVAAGPANRALVELAVQAGVSISIDASSHCTGAHAVVGRMSIEAALDTLLSGSGCSWRRVDDRSYIVIPARRTVPSANPPPLETVAAAQTPIALSEIVVTATKRPLPLERAPYPISSVSGASLEASPTRDLSDLTDRTEGLTTTHLGSGRDKFFVRGLADSPISGFTQSMVAVYLDGSRLTYDAPYPDLRLTDIDHIEVLRGPQASLYGAGSMAGIIHIVTHPPDLDRFAGELSLTSGATYGGQASAAVDVVLNAPLLRGRAAIRAVGYWERTGGYIDDANLALDDTGNVVREGGRLTALWRVTDDWSLRGGLAEQTIRADDSQYGFDKLSDDQRALRLREPSRNDFDGLSLALQGPLAGASFSLTSTIQTHDLFVRHDASAAAGLFGGGEAPAQSDQFDHISVLEHEAVLSSPIGARLTWLLGVFVSGSRHERRSDVSQGPQTLYLSQRTNHTYEYAAFGEATWPITPALRLTLGGRFFRLEADVDAQTTVGNRPANAFGGDSVNTGFAPKLVLGYHLTNDIEVYVSGGEGYRAAGFNTETRSPDGMPSQREFDGDEIDSYEIGGRASLLDHNLVVRAALFRVDWHNIQSDRVAPDGLPYTANLGDGRNVGLELESTVRLNRWTVSGSTLLNNPRLVRVATNLPDTGDRSLPGVADFTANVRVRWDEVWRGSPIYFGAAVGYVGSSSLSVSPGLTSAMGGLVTSEITAGTRRGDWSIDAAVTNLANLSGDTFNYGNPFLLGRVEVSTPPRPLTVSVVVSRHF